MADNERDGDGDGDAGSACAAFHASLRAERAWRNVQPVLLASFEAVARLLATQEHQIRSLEHELRNAQRAAREESERWRAEARGVFATKADVAVGIDLFETKAGAAAALDEFGAAMRADISGQLEDWKQAMEAEIRELRQSHKATQSEAARECRDEQQRTLEREKLRDTQSDAMRNDIDAVSHKLRCIEEKLATQVAAWRQEVTASVESRPGRDEVAKLLSRKLSSAEARRLLAEKADLVRLEELSSQFLDKMRSAQESVMADLAQQLRESESVKKLASNTTQLKQNMDELLSVVESLQQEVGEMRVVTSQKLSVEDAKQLVESRTTLIGLENALSHIESAFAEDFVRKPDHARVVQQVQDIKQQLRSEMYQARYIWKEGRPSGSQTIAWSTQVVNTSADVFVWKSGSDKVMLKIPGLYHLQVAFFTDFTPTVQVLVNGEPGLVLLGSDDGDDDNDDHAAAPLRRATQGFKRVHHSAGNIVGLSVDAFLALPARAVIQISYDIDEKAQGFLNLRKL